MWLWLLGCVAISPPPPTCNGAAALCDRPLDEVTFPGTHNAMSNAADGWFFPNQPDGLTSQLDAGVRAMMLDVQDDDGEPMLCHGSCELGSQPLREGLAEVRTFVATHPGEVLLFIIEDYVSAAAFTEVAAEVGLDGVAYVHDGGDWPTLGELTAEGLQVVLTAQGGGGAEDYYQDAWTLFFDTPYAAETVDDFSCEVLRGSTDNPLFLVNHWLDALGDGPAAAEEANTEAVLGGHASACVAEYGRPINFLAVDHYDRGALFEVVRQLNGLDP